MLNCDCATNENLVAETSSLLVKIFPKGVGLQLASFPIS